MNLQWCVLQRSVWNMAGAVVWNDEGFFKNETQV
jgi:hypothetical protein